MGKLSTHVLDTLNGVPAQGVHIALYALHGEKRQLITRTTTNADGRCDEPLLQDEAMKPGVYELSFLAGDYFTAMGATLPEPRFLDEVVIRFGIANATQNYHVPLLVTPWAYTTYRGS